MTATKTGIEWTDTTWNPVAVFVKQLGANVRDRDDAGFLGDFGDAWDLDDFDERVVFDPDGDGDCWYQGAPVRVLLRDRKGGNPDEWPQDLRVRQFPEARL